MTHLIGINGRLRSGKDTAYEIIADLRENVKRAAFADPLKLSAALALGLDPATVEEAVTACNLLKESGRITVSWDDGYGGNEGFLTTGRQYLQFYGTEAHRNVFGDDFWVRATLPDDWFNKHDCDTLVITDVRFQNEADRIIELGGTIIQIDAERRLGALPEDAHISEHPLPLQAGYFVVPNNGTLEDFHWGIREVIA